MLLLARTLRGRFEIVLALPDCPATQDLIARAVQSGIRLAPLDAAAPSLEGRLAQLVPDLVHVHAGIGWEGHAMTRAAAAARLPVLRTEHLPYLLTDEEQKAEHAEALGHCAAVLAVSEASAETFRAAGVAPGNLAVIRNGILPGGSSQDRTSVRRALGIGDGETLLLNVARFAPQKGHAILLRAFSQLAANRPGLRLALVGAGEGRADTEALVIELGLAGRVTFLGHREDVADLLRASDLFVLPSLFEGLPLALLEAMAAGVPAVATRIGGTLEAIGADHPLLCDAGDVDGLAAAIAAALDDPGLTWKAASAAHTRFSRHFHADRMASETASLYLRLLESNVLQRGSRMNRTRIGFIGAGGIANRHLGVLERFEDVELVAFSDMDFGRAADAAKRFGARAFDDYRAMLEAGGLDAVYVCVPPFAHGAIEMDLIAAKLPFFVEKPLSLDIETAEHVARHVAQSGLVTAVGYHWRYLDIVDEAKRHLVANPARLVSGYWLDATPPPQWWWKQDRSGGQMVEQTTHILDLARWLVGDVMSVFGQAQHSERPDFPGLDVATASTASLRFASGAVGNIASTCLLRWGHRIGLHLFADGLAIELTDREIMVDVGHGRPVRHAEGDPVWREDRDFIDAVRGVENRIRCPYAEALETHRVALAVSQSAASGKVIDLSRPKLKSVREVANV